MDFLVLGQGDVVFGIKERVAQQLFSAYGKVTSEKLCEDRDHIATHVNIVFLPPIAVLELFKELDHAIEVP